MSQACYLGARAEQSSTPSAYKDWLTAWCNLPLGPKCKLPLCCTSQFEALIDSIGLYNEQAFMPRRSPVPIQHVVFLCLDSAGLSDEDPSSVRACGGWAVSTAFSGIKWFQEACE